MSVPVTYISIVKLPASRNSSVSGEPSGAPPSRFHRHRSCKGRLSRSFVTKLRLTLSIHNSFINNDAESDPATPRRSPFPWKAIVGSEAGLDCGGAMTIYSLVF
jgi:hypothetical protein